MVIANGAVNNTQPPNSTDLINTESKNALAAKIAALQKARDSAIGGYNQQITALPGQYQPLRNQTDLRGAQDSRAITEQMAAQGNWRSGANQSAQTANTAATANGINSLNVQQQSSLDKLKQAIAQVQSGYESDVASATADNEAQKMAALIAQANQDKNFGLQQDQFNQGASQWDKTFAQNTDQFNQNYALQLKQLALSQAKANIPKTIPQSSPEGTMNTDDAIIEVQAQLDSGSSPGNVAYAIEQQRETLKRQGINVDALIKSVWDKAGVQTKPEVQDAWR